GLVRGEVLKDVGVDQLLDPGMPDADADAPVIRPDHRVDRAQPVVAGRAAAALDPDLAGPQVELVMDDDDVRRRDLIKAHRRQHRLAGIVHEGLRPQQQAPLPGDHPLGELALEAVAKRRKAVAPGDRLGRHEADIVAVAGIARARIAEPDDQAHRLTKAQDDGADPGAAPGAAPGAVPGATAGCSPSTTSGGAAAAVAAAAAAAAASSRTAEEAAIVAIVKSRSWITGRAPSGISTAPIWMLSPISSPSRFTTI